MACMEEALGVRCFDLTSIPKVLPVKWNIDIRGEILCDLNSFADYNEKMEKPFKNARNAVAGILGSGMILKRSIRRCFL